MAQATAVLPTGVRAFNAVTTSGAVTDFTLLEVSAEPGGLLSLKSMDGTNSGEVVTVRVMSIREDNEPFEVARFTLQDPETAFSKVFKGGVYGHPDDLRARQISPKGTENLGLLGSRFRVLISSSGATRVALGATFDRRVDGPLG